MRLIPRLVEEGIQVDAIVTDPPYHLTSTLSRFGNIDITDDTKTSQRLRKKDTAAARLAHGFMNQQWDGGDIAFQPETWCILATILRPGGFLLAFGGTRTAHRMVCAIEDSGFVIQDTIAWMYGSGFPKRRDMLKPAFEPICVAYMPDGKRTLQVDECRIGTGPSPSAAMRARGKAPSSCRPGEYGDGHAIQNRIRPERWLEPVPGEQLGRWPANVIHDGSDEVMEAFAAFGEEKDGTAGRRSESRGTITTSGLGGYDYTWGEDTVVEVRRPASSIAPRLIKWIGKVAAILR